MNELVRIALRRHPGYEDILPELLIEDAMLPDWPWQFLRDDGSAVVVSIERPNGYERVKAVDLAKDAVKPSWPSWIVVDQ